MPFRWGSLTLLFEHSYHLWPECPPLNVFSLHLNASDDTMGKDKTPGNHVTHCSLKKKIPKTSQIYCGILIYSASKSNSKKNDWNTFAVAQFNMSSESRAHSLNSKFPDASKPTEYDILMVFGKHRLVTMEFGIWKGETDMLYTVLHKLFTWTSHWLNCAETLCDIPP